MVPYCRRSRAELGRKIADLRKVASTLDFAMGSLSSLMDGGLVIARRIVCVARFAADCHPAGSDFRHMLTRRTLTQAGLGMVAAGVAALSAGGLDGAAAAAAQTTPTRPIAGTSLRILFGHHAVLDAEYWLSNFATQWGQQNQVAVSVDFADSATIPHALKTELALGSGHDLIEHIAPLPMYARDLADLSDVLAEASTRHGAPLLFCRQDGLDPVSGRTYGFVHGYAPLAVYYRQSMWEAVQMASGPRSWSDLEAGSEAIWETQGIPLAIGFSDDLTSTNAIISALWANGASVIDADGRIALESDATVAVVERFARLYASSMLPTALKWTLQSSDDAMVNNLAAVIINPLSAYRWALLNRRDTGIDMRVNGPLTGDLSVLAGQQPVMPAGVRFVSMVPNFSRNQDTAKEFLLALVATYDQLTVASKTYNFPAYPSTVPLLKQAGGPLDNDPLYPDQGRTLSILKDSNRWTVNLGWPGPTTPLVAAATLDGVLGAMVAQAAIGRLTAQESVQQAAARLGVLQQELG